MSALSDFAEERILDHIVGNSAYVVPWHLHLSTGSGSVNGGDYDIWIASDNGNKEEKLSYTASSDDAGTVLDNLESKVDSSNHPVQAHRYADQQGNETLMIEGDDSQQSDEVNWVISDTASSGTSWGTVERRVWGALYFNTGDPTDSDSGIEVIDGTNSSGYKREKIPFNPASSPSGLIDNSSDVEFGPAGSGGWDNGGSEEIKFAGVRDAPSKESSFYSSASSADDHLLFHGQLSSSKKITENDSFVFRSGDLDITLD